MPPLDDHPLDRATVRLSLSYRPPLDWGSLLGYLAARATPGIQAVDAGGRYCRSIRLHGHLGYVVVGPAAAGEVLRVELSAALLPVLVPLLARLRRLFDLDADPRAVAGHGRLARLLAEPLPGAPPALAYLPISAERLAGASLASVTGIGLPRARAECVLVLARAVAGGELPELAGDGPAQDPAEFGRRLRDLPGVGAWTAEYVVMRALHWPDAFPEGDIALRKAMGGLSPARLRAAAESWRPWRAYAAQHLWAGLADPPSRGSPSARSR